jgi:integrase
VSILLPNDVAQALRALPTANPKYFFWTGSSRVTSVTGFWHHFRDTFAVTLLQAGVSLENVYTLLGHQSIRITQKHYSPWIKTRQDALDRELLRVNAAMSQEQNRNN